MDVINYYIRQPLSGEDLKNMIGKHNVGTIFMRYHELAGKTVEQLFPGNNYAVVLFEEIHGSNRPIGHWVVLLKHSDHYEHFDSYGIGIDEEEKIANEYGHLLTNIFRSANMPLVESTRKLQEDKEDVNTCGRWVVARIHLHNYELPQFYNFIEMIHQPYDRSVVLMTMFTL